MAHYTKTSLLLYVPDVCSCDLLLNRGFYCSLFLESGAVPMNVLGTKNDKE